MKQRIAVATLLMLGMLPAAGLYAQQTAQTTFQVKARVQAVCEVTATDLDFGTYGAKDPSQKLGTTLLRATCTPGSTYNVGLNEGTTAGATVQARAMKPAAGTQNLSYQLYSNSARSVIWGNTSGTDTVTGVGTGMAQDHTVFGAVPAAQVVPAGDYSDTITVRVYY
jgi:spore coat protein U-like protein